MTELSTRKREKKALKSGAHRIWALTFALFVVSAESTAARTAEENAAVDNFIRSLGQIEQPEVINPQKLSDDPQTVGGLLCQSTKWRETPYFQDFLFSKSSVDVLYPGALLDGRSVREGAYALSDIRPGPITISANIPGIDKSRRAVEKPSFSSVQSAINELVAEPRVGGVAAELTSQVASINSVAQLKASLGMTAGVEQVFDAGANFGIDASKQVNVAVLKFKQKYFDIVLDPPARPSDLIAEEFSIDEARGYLDDLSPVYVASASYGRFIVFLFESSDLTIDLESKIHAAFVAPDTPVKLGVHQELDAAIKKGKLKTQAFILGGSAAEAAKATNSIDGIVQLMQSGGELSAANPGKPISYSLKYLSTKRPVKVVDETEYTKLECSEVFERYRVKAVSFKLDRNQDLAFPQIDLHGRLAVGTSKQGEVRDPVLWSHHWAFLGIGGYPIHVGKDHSKRVEGNADVMFDDLSLEDSHDAYIEIHHDINASWAGIDEPFYPKSTRIYLDEFNGQTFEDTATINTSWHKLHIEYEIQGVPGE